MGLTRQQARTLALVFIVVGIGLADIFTGIDDWLNWGVVWGLIWLGCWIYPYNTHSLLNGYVNKLQRLAKKALKNPVWLGLSLALSYALWTWYKAKLGGMP